MGLLNLYTTGALQLQDVVQGVGSVADGSHGRERQPLSPANRDTSQRTPPPPARKSPFGKSSPLRPPPAKTEARPCEEPGDSLSHIPVFSFKEHENELAGPQVWGPCLTLTAPAFNSVLMAPERGSGHSYMQGPTRPGGSYSLFACMLVPLLPLAELSCSR